MKDAWDRLRERLPQCVADAVERELERREAEESTCQLALVMHLRRGRYVAYRVSEVENMTVPVLTE